MCSNYEISTRNALSLFDVKVDQFALDIKSHLYVWHSNDIF